MIGGVSRARHALVGAAIAGTTILAATGVIGGGVHPERFETWQVVIVPTGDGGLRFRELFDQDFGDEKRSGHEGFIPHDLGLPTDISAFSPDAPYDLDVFEFSSRTRIRIGDPAVKITGQHRYRLAYTLPDANIREGSVLSIDVLDPDPVETDIVEVVLIGMELDDPRCFVGALGASDECEFVEEDGRYRAVIEPLAAGAGVTVEADVVAFDGDNGGEVVEPEIPERRRPPNRALTALGMAGLGGIGVLPIYRWARRRGRNEVFAGGAADAAYGELAPPRPDGTVEPPPPVRLVPDDEMDDLATIEFVPPTGVTPWEASVLLTERFGDSTVEAWISGLVATEAITVEETGRHLSIATGPQRTALAPDDAVLLDAILSIKDPYVTGKYDQLFATAWSKIKAHQRERIAASGWWKRMPPGGGFRPSISGSPFGLIVMAVFVLVWSGSTFGAFLGAFRSWAIAIAVGLLFPAVIAFMVYRVMLPARSAAGSALALRAESFRRFLHASEGKHVEWAWSQGLLREYSAWAVAVGEADAWSDALERANVPAPARAAAGPIIVHRGGASMRSSKRRPQSSGGGRSGGRSGGGSRGGRVGGGGGGRSRGSF